MRNSALLAQPGADRAAGDPGRARQLSSLPGGVERGHLACRPAEDPSPGRGLLPHDHRRRAYLCHAGHADIGASGETRHHGEGSRRAGGRTARHHFDDRERPAHDLSVRRRAVAPGLRRAVCAVRERTAGGQATVVRAGRRHASLAAQPARDGPGLGGCLRQARRGRRRCRIRFPRAQLVWSRPRHFNGRLAALVRPIAQRAAFGRA